MRQRFTAILIALAAVCAARAHFIFAVPEPGGATAKVFLSETLEPSGVGTDLVAKADLSLRTADGAEAPLELHLVDDYYLTAVPATDLGVVHGIADLGVMDRGTPSLLLYYPKTIVGDAFAPETRVGESAVVEIVPHGRPGAVQLEVLARGKPQAGSEVTVILPDGSTEIVKTDARGLTETLTAKGRYGAWARYWEDTPGEREGKQYEQVRHYAMLVFDAPAPHAGGETESSSEAATLPAMPEATSSFGSAVANGWLYVYGGHVSPTHNYSTDAVSGKFHRMRLDGGSGWEELPAGPGLQGMNLAAHNGMIYRVGGMAPQNAPGDPTDNRSVADAARFNPEANRWEALPSLPEPRSSHDVAVLGDKLFVLGGWTMQAGGKEDWLETSLVMDLSSDAPVWEPIEQPFQRRAFMAAAYRGRVYVVGGFSSKSEVMRTVSIYDPESGEWSEGPELPEHGRTTGFAPAAGVHDGRLYVSIDDGTLLRLSKSGGEWEVAGKTTPRLAHRLASSADAVLVPMGHRSAPGRPASAAKATPSLAPSPHRAAQSGRHPPGKS